MRKKIDFYADAPAKKISYGSTRSKKKVRGIVIHWTENVGDTAAGNVNYFSEKGDNVRKAGAHFFVDQKGHIGRSIRMNKTAYSVGNPNGSYLPGSYYSILNNSNTVSIELCDIVNKEPSEAMIYAVKILIEYIRTYCPNATEIVRHYDIVRKNCPGRFVKDGKAWQVFKKKIGG